MASEFFTILTAAGRAKIAAALAEQKQIVLQTMVVGDGGGQYAEPKESQTKVVREVWRGPLNTLKIAPENPAWVIAEAVLPESVGGWYIREVGLLDKDGVLIAIGKFPETYKPKLPAGASKQIVIRAVMEVTNAAAVTLMVDPSLVMATVDYVDSSIEEHERSHNHPDATLTQKGFTQLNRSTNSTLETQAATPKAVKAAMDKANEALEKAGADKAHKHPWADITGVPDGTTAQKGVVKLNSSTNSTSTTEAATPSAVKAAYDLANGKAASSHTHAWGQITGVPNAGNGLRGIVALANDPANTSTDTAASSYALSRVYSLVSEKAPINHTHPWNQITGIPVASTTQRGIVQLNSSRDSTSTTEAATPYAVKLAYDHANTRAPASHTHVWSHISGVPDASTSQKGVVKLNSTVNSASTTEAATASAVKAAYDRATAAINAKNSASQGTNGWWKCADSGLIIQWGTTTYRSTLFPITFPSVCVSVVASNGDYYRDDNNSIRAVSKTGFTPYNAHDTSGTMLWIAIGY